jgi:hypothetical protein
MLLPVPGAGFRDGILTGFFVRLDSVWSENRPRKPGPKRLQNPSKMMGCFAARNFGRLRGPQASTPAGAVWTPKTNDFRVRRAVLIAQSNSSWTARPC